MKYRQHIVIDGCCSACGKWVEECTEQCLGTEDVAIIKASTLTAYRAAIKAADEMREDFQRVWSDYSAGKHDGIEAYLRARAEIGE